MKKNLLHTPEGVRDIYNMECEKQQQLQDKLKHSMESYGYKVIQTPTFEFFDIFSSEIGTTASKELYKFFDRDGNTLVLRPDITPSIARAAAKYFMGEDMPIRLYYLGNTFINHISYQGRLKENTQLGGELIGDNSVEADAEMIALAVDCLKASGLKEFQLSVGHADFFTGLVEAAKLDDETEESLRELIENKNFFGVEERLEEQQINKELRSLFQMLGGFYTTTEELKRAKTLATSYPRILASIERLEAVHEALKVYDVDRFVSYEPGMISNYRYYTGITFAGYTFKSGSPIVKGGRYDKLLSHFGKPAASIGFAVVVDQLLAALTRAGISIYRQTESTLILYHKSMYEKAISRALQLRNQGKNVELIAMNDRKTKEEYQCYAVKNGKTELIFMDGE